MITLILNRGFCGVPKLQFVDETEENLQKVKDTRGFLLIVYQGVRLSATYMQRAEAKQASWLRVPLVGIYSLETLDILAGNVDAKKLVKRAKREAATQWLKGTKTDIIMVSEPFEPLESADLNYSEVDAKGNLHGRARATFPSGCNEEEFEEDTPNGKGQIILSPPRRLQDAQKV